LLIDATLLNETSGNGRLLHDQWGSLAD
jgi:hypothetical protein